MSTLLSILTQLIPKRWKYGRYGRLQNIPKILKSKPSTQCTEDSAVEDPWVGRAVALYQLFTLLLIPLLLSIGCYQAVIRWAK